MRHLWDDKTHSNLKAIVSSIMGLLPLVTMLRLTLFVIYFLWVCSAQDCGNKQVARTIIVDQSGKTKFSTVQAAIDSIAEHNNQWVNIHINAGTYTEKVQIPAEKPCVFLRGQGSDVTIITYNEHGKTNESATFTSYPSNVVAKDITFKNSLNVAAVRIGQVDQAVAARIYGDKSAFYNCGFIGFQDTLWDAQGRHYFKNCYIEGAVDFIFGNGQSYYEDFLINATSSGFVTAQARQSGNDPSGFVFKGGSVVGGVSVRSCLGRAWGPYSRVIFLGTKLGSLVEPQGWDAWNYTTHESNFTYAEVDCTGPGADTSKRVPWMTKLSASQLLQFSRSSFIDQDGWIEGSDSA